MENVLVRAADALVVVAVEQAFGREAVAHELQFPDEVVGVLEAGIGAAGAERRDLMRRVAGEQHPPVAEFFHAPALEGVDRHPFELELDTLAEHRLEARDHPLRLLLLLAVDVPAELQIDAPDVVGLLVQTAPTVPG